jgi:peptidyl-prolyl cis-trans isomerase C
MKRLLLLSSVIGLAACSASQPPAGAMQDPAALPVLLGAPQGEAVARVDDVALTAPLLDVFARGRGLDPADPAQRQQALDALIENVLLARSAQEKGLVARPEVQAELALVRLQQLAGRELAGLREQFRPEEAEIRALYDQEAARTGGIELHLKHILFADEAGAAAALQRALAEERDFDTLMAEYAAQGARQARDLGWANLSQLPPELGEAARVLRDGEVAPTVVGTSFGWHVVQRVASRPYSPPPFEQVREAARQQLAERRLAEAIESLREAAEVEVPTPGSVQGN